MEYFSSDWHLGHANIIKYDKRPFKTVKEMDETIIQNITSVLKKGDKLYFLGDFSLTKNPNEIEGHMKAISYTGVDLFFIKGNHDKSDIVKLYQKYGSYLGEQKAIYINDKDAHEGKQMIVLNHYAMRVWDKSHHGAWHLYGHSHHTLKEDPNSLSFDVGINGWDYQLIDYPTVKSKMSKKNFTPIDHHGKTGRI